MLFPNTGPLHMLLAEAGKLSPPIFAYFLPIFQVLNHRSFFLRKPFFPPLAYIEQAEPIVYVRSTSKYLLKE